MSRSPVLRQWPCGGCQVFLSYPIRVTAQYLPRQRSRVLARINHYCPVDDNRRDAGSVLMRVIKRGLVCDLLWVKDGEVSTIALTQEATIYQPQSRGCSSRHFVNRLWQCQEPQVTHVMPQQAREGLVKTRMWLAQPSDAVGR